MFLWKSVKSWKFAPIKNFPSIPYVAVPGRNRTLFRCIFRAYYCVQSAVKQNFHYGRGSYALCKLMNNWHVYTVHMGPTPNRSSVLQGFERGNALEIHNGIMFDFYPGLPHMCVHGFWMSGVNQKIVITLYANASDRPCKQGGGEGYCRQRPWQEARSISAISKLFHTLQCHLKSQASKGCCHIHMQEILPLQNFHCPSTSTKKFFITKIYNMKICNMNIFQFMVDVLHM